jgi:hypothetical protein
MDADREEWGMAPPFYMEAPENREMRKTEAACMRRARERER